jgi:tripartite-type tricarboxylate transporter receptor subunit TctC
LKLIPHVLVASLALAAGSALAQAYPARPVTLVVPFAAGGPTNAAVRFALKDPVVLQRMAELGAEIVPDAKLTPEGLRTWLQAETDRYGPMIRSAGAFAD